jgi:hypothetical protein
LDDRRFDALARVAAGRAPCRSMLRGLVGAALIAVLGVGQRRSAAAQEGGAPVGGTCTATAQCRPGEMAAVICGDNGIAADGDLNSCVDRGCCASDADCCGDMRCAPTGDVCSVCAFPPFPTRFLGEVCATDEDCVASVVYRITCADGRCAAPGVAVPPSGVRLGPDPEAAMATAEELARLEAAGAFDALYDRMHPDAQAIVPRAAVVGWYEDVFAPREPVAAGAIKVRFVEWRWPVTGVAYPETAEVTYWQRFADEPVVRDAVRLVEVERGEWRWFFGRDRAFVAEQIARYGEDAAP